MSRFANEHERAFELTCMLFGGALSESDQKWLELHLAACPECAVQGEQTQETVASLKGISISAGSDLVRSTQRRVRGIVVEKQARTRRVAPIYAASAVASALMTIGTPYLWQSFDLTGHWLHIPDLMWQMGFLVAWFTPAMAAASLAVWFRPQLTRTRVLRATA
jgi:anti-sigma factor RsiW